MRANGSNVMFADDNLILATCVRPPEPIGSQLFEFISSIKYDQPTISTSALHAGDAKSPQDATLLMASECNSTNP